MRFLLLAALVACDPASGAPANKSFSVVVQYDDLLERELDHYPLGSRKPRHFWGDCKLMADGADAIVQCNKRKMFVRFSCRDHAGPEHALRLMVDSNSFSLYCR